MSSRTKSPVPWLSRFTSDLGWPPLKKHRHCAPADVITWYLSGVYEGRKLDCFLQINECPVGQQKQFSAAVYAPRYRLCSGWHTFKVAADTSSRTAARLATWLAATHFSSAAGRRAYRIAHPETIGYSWIRIRRDGPPYQIVDAKAGLTIRSN